MAPRVQLGVMEILDLASKAKTVNEKIQVLRSQANPYLGAALRLIFDDDVHWADLGKRPFIYRPSDIPGSEMNMLRHLQRIHFFFKGGKFDTIQDSNHPNYRRQEAHRQTEWLMMLESLAPRDAEFMAAAVDRRLPKFDNLMNRKIILDAFPELKQFMKAKEKKVEETADTPDAAAG